MLHKRPLYGGILPRPALGILDAATFQVTGDMSRAVRHQCVTPPLKVWANRRRGLLSSLLTPGIVFTIAALRLGSYF